MDVSIIIVNYRSKKEVFECISSIYDSKHKLSLEIIVVDNGSENSFDKELAKKYLDVVYLKSESNLGFGGGNNLGVRYAKGKYLFFLNPDTKVFSDAIKYLFNFLEKNKNVGIVSPLVLNKDLEIFNLQGYKELTPLNSLVSFSYLNNLFPEKSSFERYSLNDWDKKPIREVEAVNGAAFMIPKKLFEEVNGFDEIFFLYFEENDISKRVRNLGYKLYVNSNSKIVHRVAQSTKYLINRQDIYEKSRFLYLKKHYGFLKAFLISLLLKINKKSFLLILALSISLYLRIFNLSNNMQLIGDQGWFYLSARDLLTGGIIPLVGIPSSHTWLHQGPLWTYMLSVALFIFKFNPIGGAYLTALIGVLTTFLMYKIGSKVFSPKVGLISAILYSASPLIVFWERIPFDPSVIPFFTILYFFALYKWIKGNSKYFPIILFLIAVLYNLELATFTLFFPFALIFIYGFWKNKPWIRKVKNLKFAFSSILIGLIPMIPVIIYDFSHGFKQTIVFLGWTLYKPFSFLIHGSAGGGNFENIFNFISTNLNKLIFSGNLYVSIAIFTLSLLYLIYKTSKTKKIENILLLFLLLISILGIIINQTPSEAYLPIIFPFIVLLLALFFNFLLSYSKIWAIFLVIIVTWNIYFVVINELKNDVVNRIYAIDKVINLTNGQKYNLLGKGPGSQFESFTMNYEYLLWWKGRAPSKTKEKIQIIISEINNEIQVIKVRN